jgi:NAD(P)-dependent dehydrogenase (short-subunit alcohol dehydrogenase family)
MRLTSQVPTNNMSNKRIALITGANKGIGLETARQLGKEGITVLVGARDEKKGKVAAEELRKKGIDAHGVVIDGLPRDQAPTDLQCSNKIEILNVAGSFLSGAISGPKSTETARGRYGSRTSRVGKGRVGIDT